MPATATIKTRSIQGESLTAVTDRLVNLAMKEGVIDKSDGSYQVLQNTGSDMNVKVGSGSAFDRAVVEGDVAGQANFVCEHQNATVTLAIASADPTNPRIDIVILRVYDDTFDSSGNEYSDIEVITGTPAASPTAPATPNSALLLATVEVAASVSAITNSDINDQRYEAPTRGQLVETVSFSASGSFAKGDYPWLERVKARVWGGGGGGGGATLTGAGSISGGGGGGGGAYAEGFIHESDLSSSETVTVGAGGSGGTAANGSDGGTSSFGSHAVADSGKGGITVIATHPHGTRGGSGGDIASCTGDIKLSGSNGGHIWSTSVARVFTGSGGASGVGGGGGLGTITSSGLTGSNGDVPGGGGAGAGNAESQGTNKAGGDGGAGLVVLELYA